MSTQHIGSRFDGFLAEEGLLENVSAIAVKRVIVQQLTQAMQRQNMTNAELAKRMHVSRSAVARLLDTSNAHLTLRMIVKAAAALHLSIQVALES